MITVDQLLFFATSHKVRFIIHQNDFFILYKIPINDSLYQNIFLTLPLRIKLRSFSCDHKRLLPEQKSLL